MTSGNRSYDSACYDLAGLFLEGDPDTKHLDTTENRDELAQEIQEAVEDWFFIKQNPVPQ